ncbi:hypothetical protein BDV97DRAFT_346047, partial [Delphinella strobiligena]
MFILRSVLLSHVRFVESVPLSHLVLLSYVRSTQVAGRDCQRSSISTTNVLPAHLKPHCRHEQSLKCLDSGFPRGPSNNLLVGHKVQLSNIARRKIPILWVV